MGRVSEQRGDGDGDGDGVAVRLVVDVANVMGSRPDGWWRDRAGAATRLLAQLAPLAGRTVAFEGAGAGSGAVRLVEVIAVVEGRARDASAPASGIHVVAAPADGDSMIVALAEQPAPGSRAALAGASGAEASGAGSARPLVVTADRGLRERLPAATLVAGPGWLNALIGR